MWKGRVDALLFCPKPHIATGEQPTAWQYEEFDGLMWCRTNTAVSGNVILQRKGCFFVSKMSKIKETDKEVIMGLGRWYKMYLFYLHKVIVLLVSTFYLYCIQGDLVGIHMDGSAVSCCKMDMKLQLKTSSQDKLALSQKKITSVLSHCANACFSLPSLPQPHSSCGCKLNCFGNLSQLKLAIFTFVQLHIREG